MSPSEAATRSTSVRRPCVTGWERYMALDRSSGHSMTCFTRFWFHAAIDRREFVRAVGLLSDRNPLLSAQVRGSNWLPVPYDPAAVIDWHDSPRAIEWRHLPAEEFRTHWIVRRGPLRELGLDVEECGAAQGTLVVLQYSHAVSDALGAVALMQQLCCLLAEGEARFPSAVERNHRMHCGLEPREWRRRLPWDIDRIWQYFRRRPLALTAKAATKTVSGQIQFIRRVVGSYETDLLRTASRAGGVTVNDVLIAAFLRALARRIDRPGWIRIAVPTSMRPPDNNAFCNLVSMVFLDRTVSQAASENVLAGISQEMTIVKQRRLGHAMLRFLGMVTRGRGLLVVPFLRSGRTEATAVLSNLGCLCDDRIWQQLHEYRPIATDTVSPLRPGTNVSLCASHCAGRLSLTLRHDEVAIDADEAGRMLTEVIEESIRLVTNALA